MKEEVNHNENIRQIIYRILREGMLIKSAHTFDQNFIVHEHIQQEIYKEIGDSLNNIEEQNTRLIKRNKVLEEIFKKFTQLNEEILLNTPTSDTEKLTTESTN